MVCLLSQVFPLKFPKGSPPALEVLILSNNCIRGIDAEDCRGLTSLKTLDLSGNRLTSVPEQMGALALGIVAVRTAV